MTKQQIALCRLICGMKRQEVIDLLGPNHPTMKWFGREAGILVTDAKWRKVMHASYGLLKSAGLGQEYAYIYEE